MTVAVLALQGAFYEHELMLKKLGVETFEIRQLKDLEKDFDGLIIPGGESTVIGRLMKDLGLYEPLKAKILNGLPVFGTCAGLIILAKEIENDNKTHLATMNIKVKRNAYGRQLGSFYTEAPLKGVGMIPMTFIRAPYISEVLSDDVKVLATVNGNIVAALEKNMLVTSFHPELNDSLLIHEYFINLIKKAKKLA